MTIRYIGSKARVADAIVDLVGDPPRGAAFVDGFCGTGVVAYRAALRGWRVRLNDTLVSATTIASARLTHSRDVPFLEFGGYRQAIQALNATTAVKGFIWREYSPASRQRGITRKYFTEENAARIDGLRSQLKSWAAAGVVNSAEERLLLADLLTAVNRVANTAGTYGCFLRDFTPTSLQPISLVARSLFPRRVRVDVHNADVVEVPIVASDVAYFDPPYTKRQYAAYYHILETVAIGDSPTVSGVTGLRPWHEKSSDYCYKSRALSALVELLTTCAARRVVVSYSSEGHIKIDDLAAAVEQLGDVLIHELGDVGRYRPNRSASQSASSVREYLLELAKPAEFDAVA